MKPQALPKKPYFLSINDEVRMICQDLDQYGISYFSHARFFDDYTSYVLSNNASSVYNHMSKQYPINKPSPKGKLGNKFHYFPFLDSADVDARHIATYRAEFNMDHPIYFIEKYKHYTDLYIYCTHAGNPTILNFFLNNIELLEKFKFYFKDKAHTLIQKSNKNRIHIPPHMWSNYADNQQEKDLKVQKTFDQVPLKHYILNIHDKEISMTKREVDVIKQVAAGSSFKEAARTMGISARTIETYLNNAKRKLNIKKKSELVKIISEYNLK